MSERKCGICAREMVPMNVTSPGGTAVLVTFCRICDRRRCSACGHHEQDTFANRCSNCKVMF